jgi:hypothetical protein
LGRNSAKNGGKFVAMMNETTKPGGGGFMPGNSPPPASRLEASRL